MKLYAPKYYKDFKCIADKCKHSCCVGWEIDIDERTMEKYSLLSSGYGERIVKSIERGETPHFGLCEGERCPHLDEKGLCRIITELGETYLCDICREHPRFYNDTPNGREVGLGMACEEACRIILSSDDYAVIEQIGSTVGRTRKSGINTLEHRELIYSILSDTGISYEERLNRIGKRYGIRLTERNDLEWRELLRSLEYLDEAHRDLFACYSSDTKTPKELEKPLERAFAYFVFRHCAEADSDADLYACVGFCLFCERLLASVLKNSELTVAGAIENAARVVSEEIEYSTDNTEAIKFEFLFAQ